MDRNTKIAGYGLAAIIGALVLWPNKKKQQDIVYPGQRFDGVQGGMTIVRLPRGVYNVFGGDNLVHEVSQSEAGLYTDITLVLGDYATDYTVNLVFQEDSTKRTHDVTVFGRKVLA